MKKMFFAVIAAFVMSVSITSCGGSSSSEENASEEKIESLSPEDQVLGCMQEMVDIMKSTTIKSAEDAQALKEKMEGVQKKVEEITKTFEEKMKDMSEEDQKKYIEKVTALQEEGQVEVERLQKEAEEIGVNLDEL